MTGSRRWPVLPLVVLLHGSLLGCSAGTAASGNASAQGDDVTTTPTGPTADSVPVAFRVIPGARTQVSTHGVPARVVIRDAAEWGRFWGGIVAPISPTPPVPPIDFTLQFVAAAAMGERPSGGHAIDVTAVYVRGGAVHVVVKSISPGGSCGVATVMTAPVAAVAIDRVQGEVRFIEIAETTDCG